MTSSVWRRRSLITFGIGLTGGAFTTGMVLLLIATVAHPLVVDPLANILMLFVIGWVGFLLAARGRWGWPSAHRQVPSTIIGRSESQGSLVFGYAMGTGVRTYLSSPIPYIAVAAVALTASPLVAACVSTGFAGGRWLMPTLRTLSRDGDAWDSDLRRNSAYMAGFLFALAAAAGLMLVRAST